MTRPIYLLYRDPHLPFQMAGSKSIGEVSTHVQTGTIREHSSDMSVSVCCKPSQTVYCTFL